MNKLSIPERITLRREFFPGFGWPELRQWMAAEAPVLAATVLVSVCCRDNQGVFLAAILIFLLLSSGLVSIFTRQPDGPSIFLFLIRRLRFRRNQQKFYYRHKEVLFFEEAGR